MVVQAQQVLIVGTAPRIKDENPDTWIRRAWAGSELIESEMPPAGIVETEWYILRRHVYQNEGLLTIKQSFGEPLSRIVQFAEDATRRAIPDRALTAEAEFRGGVQGTPEARAHADLMINVRRAYSALGSPLGSAPEDVASFFAWMADNDAVIQAIRTTIGDNPISVDRAETAPEVVRLGPDTPDGGHRPA